jgi:MFS family permease
MSAPAQSRAGFGRVVGASIIGTTVEWYDFFLYGSAAALVFPALFFPEQSDFAGTLLSFGTYAVGFAARPIGALVFGHFGDRIGRKKLLVISLLMMGGATFAIGLLPTFGTVGVLAPLLLVTLRLIQGFALGGEWGGAVLLVSEHGKPENRGFWSSWPQAGAPAGNLLATGVLALLAAFQSDAAFESWGWRIPFLLSAVLILVGLFVRLAVSESPVFLEAQRVAAEKAAETGVAEKAPILTVLGHYKREVLVAMGARIAENVSFYLLTTFSLAYLTKAQGADSSFTLNALVLASAVHLVTIPLWGRALRPDRPQAGVPVRRRRHRGVGFRALRAARGGQLLAQRLRHHGRAALPRRHVRPPGRILRRALRHQVALHRRRDRIAAGLAGRRSSCAADRARPAGQLRGPEPHPGVALPARLCRRDAGGGVLLQRDADP